ncbi:T9SS type A sorting domain-containing protein [Bacteroidales bacterium OttesenSCG-928-I21]|nr:T9SS type A sorting domain-containing protein [Bacteroidales bacterium OttesenSCG-928-I21]
MKKLLLFLACTLIVTMQALAQDTIRLTWEAGTIAKAAKVQATTGTNNISVDWGDGNIQPFSGNGYRDVTLSHTYSTAGSYNVTISSVVETNIIYLSVAGGYNNSNGVSALDISKALALTTLDCYCNQLASLDVSANTELAYLYCYYNQLTSLDVSANTELIYLDCCYNQLTSLDLSANTELTNLWCSHNALSLSDLYAASEMMPYPHSGIQIHALQSVVVAIPCSLAGEMSFNGRQTEFVVSKNGATAVEDTDYSLDYSAETITFLGLGDYVVTMTNWEINTHPGFQAQVIMTFEVREARTDASLSNLIVSEGILTPEFDTETLSYTVNVGNEISSITITAVTTDENATVAGDGELALQTGENPFDIIVTAEDGTTTKTYTVKVVRSTVGVDIIENSNISVYPNPAKDLLNINLESLNGKLSVSIYNMQGQVCYEQAVQGSSIQTISLAGLSKGIYFVRIDNEIIKLIVQ